MENQKVKKLVKETLQRVLAENTKVNFAEQEFIIQTGVNEDPNKKGIKIQFVPVEYKALTKTKRNDIAIELEKRLEDGLAKYDMRIERDRELKDKTIIGFFIYIEYIDKIVRKVLKNQNPNA